MIKQKLLTLTTIFALFFTSMSYGENNENSGVSDDVFRFEQDPVALRLFDGDAFVYGYIYAFIDHQNVPVTDNRRFAGDYLYPLNGLDGENLTDDAPKDHCHHHGVFWTWPHVSVWEPDGTRREYDLWTSNTPIRQRFVRFGERSTDADAAEFVVENGWYVDGKSTTPDAELDASKTGEKIAENERFYGEKIVSEFVRVKTFPIEIFEGVRGRMIDIELTLIPTEKPISLRGAENKSYGGLTIRFRPSGKEGVDRFITTDEGVASGDMPEKPLRWADYTSRFGAVDTATGEPTALSGAAIFLSPNFPEFPPTWLTRYYGPLCVGWPGVIEKKLEPGEKTTMKARIWIHEGLVSTEILQKAFEKWAKIEKMQ